MSKWPRFAPRENWAPLAARCAANWWVAPAASVRTNTATRPVSSRRRSGSGSCAMAASNTATWSTAVFDPALPGRSSSATGSPPPPVP